MSTFQYEEREGYEMPSELNDQFHHKNDKNKKRNPKYRLKSLSSGYVGENGR